jgi:hypothetical protein
VRVNDVGLFAHDAAVNLPKRNISFGESSRLISAI